MISKAKSWDVTKVAMIGAVCGLLYGAAKHWSASGGMGDPARFVGVMIGSAVGGALIFGVLAVIRNAFVK